METAMQTENNLLPCPVCGGGDVRCECLDDVWSVRCACGFSAGKSMCLTGEYAEALWNSLPRVAGGAGVASVPFACASTEHITVNDDRLLARISWVLGLSWNGDMRPPMVYAHERGWFVRLAGDFADSDARETADECYVQGLSDACVSLFSHLAKLGFRWLYLSGDGPVITGFPLVWNEKKEAA